MKDENEHIPFNNEPGNFGLPGGYFQKSATSIFNKIEWQEEHKDFPKLTELKHQNTNYGFNVPVEYFAKSAEHFENLRYPALFSLKRNSGFSVPADYFEQAEVNELGKVLSDAKDELFSFENLTIPLSEFQAEKARISVRYSCAPASPVQRWKTQLPVPGWQL